MALTQLPGTVEYLTDAAHLLRMAAPETSAHLLSQRNHLLTVLDIPQSDVQRQHVCGACGHIMIPGQASSLCLESRRASQQKRCSSKREPALAKQSTGGVAIKKVVHCGNCHRCTKIGLPPAGKATRRKAATPVSLTRKPMDVETQQQPPPPPAKMTANATSKKRAKNRKAGLQALLSGQQQQTANPLSLASFMQK